MGPFSIVYRHIAALEGGSLPVADASLFWHRKFRRAGASITRTP
jgi:hypothetical protein